MWGLASQQGSWLWNLRNSRDAFGNVKEGAGYTAPPTPMVRLGAYADPGTGWLSPTDGGPEGDYDPRTGDALAAALDGRNRLYAGMLGKASQLAGIGMDIGDFAASFNPICNAFTAATGQKASGRCASIVDRVFAGLSLIPGGFLEASLSKLGKLNPGKKTVTYFMFKRVPNRGAWKIEPMTFAGHVGFSFGGPKIYGFTPVIDATQDLSSLISTLRNGVPGQVGDNTAIFRNAEALEIPIFTVTEQVSHWTYYRARFNVWQQSRHSSVKGIMYSFPTKGQFKPGFYNCATYPGYVGLPCPFPAELGKFQLP